MSKKIIHLEVEGKHLVVEMSGKSKVFETEEFKDYVEQNKVKTKT